MKKLQWNSSLKNLVKKFFDLSKADTKHDFIYDLLKSWILERKKWSTFRLFVLMSVVAKVRAKHFTLTWIGNKTFFKISIDNFKGLAPFQMAWFIFWMNDNFDLFLEMMIKLWWQVVPYFVFMTFMKTDFKKGQIWEDQSII